MKRFVPGCQSFLLQIWYIFKGVPENVQKLSNHSSISSISHWGGGLESRKLLIKQKLLMVEAFNQNFSVTKTQSCTEFSRIWHSILWEYLLFKLPKEIKVAKGNISVHYKTSLTIIHLDLMSYCNMDGKHKTTDTIKKRRLEAPKCAQPLSVRSNFSLEVSLCSKSQVFSVGKPHIISIRGGWDGSVS